MPGAGAGGAAVLRAALPLQHLHAEEVGARSVLHSAADDQSVSQSVFAIMEKAPTGAFSGLKVSTYSVG